MKFKEKSEFTVTNGGKNVWRFKLPESIKLKENVEIGLKSITAYNVSIGITAKNNYVSYSPNMGYNYFDFKIQTGIYNLKSLQNYVFQKMKELGHYMVNVNRPAIEFYRNPLDARQCIIKMADGYHFDLTRDDSLADVLGFTNIILVGERGGDFPLKIYNKKLRVFVDYFEIYSFKVIVKTGEKFVERSNRGIGRGDAIERKYFFMSFFIKHYKISGNTT